MAGPYSSRQVAKTMLDLAKDRKLSITNLTMQKLIYLAHGVSLVRYSQPLVNESFQAWRYGPVLEGLYHDLKVFGSSAISADHVFIRDWPSIPHGDVEAIEAIDGVLAQCGQLSGVQLVNLTHDENGPWHNVYNENIQGIEIPQDKIQVYFKTLVAH
jgi:uncharacterized phage-associated protein